MTAAHHDSLISSFLARHPCACPSCAQPLEVDEASCCVSCRTAVRLDLRSTPPSFHAWLTGLILLGLGFGTLGLLFFIASVRATWDIVSDGLARAGSREMILLVMLAVTSLQMLTIVLWIRGRARIGRMTARRGCTLALLTLVFPLIEGLALVLR